MARHTHHYQNHDNIPSVNPIGYCNDCEWRQHVKAQLSMETSVKFVSIEAAIIIIVLPVENLITVLLMMAYSQVVAKCRILLKCVWGGRV